MEDNNFIKFGPEWLRNFATRPTRRPEGREGPSHQNRPSGSSGNPNSGGTYSAASGGAIPRTCAINRNTNSRSAPNTRGAGSARVSLAKLRYGREEMLALYDRNSRPTIELRQFEQIYKPRPRAPVALYNTFGASSSFREGNRSATHSSMDKYRGQPGNAGRGRSRPDYARSWRRQNSDGEWRNERPPRQPEREHAERGIHREKWNYRKYEQLDEENIPEWAKENVEMKNVPTGTFDSSGAFHGGNEDPRFQKEIETPVRRGGYFKKDGIRVQPVYRYQPQNIPSRPPQGKMHPTMASDLEDMARSRDRDIKRNYESRGGYNAQSADSRAKAMGSEKPKEIRIISRPKDDKGNPSLEKFKLPENPRRNSDIDPPKQPSREKPALATVNENIKAISDNAETTEEPTVSEQVKPTDKEAKPKIYKDQPNDKEQPTENIEAKEESVGDPKMSSGEDSPKKDKISAEKDKATINKAENNLEAPVKAEAAVEKQVSGVENTKDKLVPKAKESQPHTFEKYQQEQIKASMQNVLSSPPMIKPSGQLTDSKPTQLDLNAMYKHTGAIPKTRKNINTNINTEYNSSQNTTYDNLMRMSEASNDDSGHFKSVMIAPNNSLRQKHQNMISSNEDQLSPLSSFMSSDMDRNLQMNKLDFGMFNMNLESTDSPLLNPPPSMPLYGLPQNLNLPMMPMSSMQNPLICNPNVYPNVSPNVSMSSQAAAMNSDVFGMSTQNMARNKPLGAMPGYTNPNLNHQSSGFPSNAFQTPYGQGLDKPMYSTQYDNTLPNMPTSRAPLLPLQNVAAMHNSSLNEIISKMRTSQFMNTQASPPFMQGNHQNMAGGNPLQNLQNFNTNLYNMAHSQVNSGGQRLDEAWLYEDPSGEVQGPFSSEAMWEWHQSGFFNPDMLIRNANDINLRPLWTYGPIPPYAAISLPKKKVSDMVNEEAMESVWGQVPRQNMDAWSQRTNELFDIKPTWDRSNNNNIPIVPPSPLPPLDINKEMKTEEQILAAIRVKQNMGLANNQNMGLTTNQNLGLASNQNMGLASNQNMGLASNQNLGLTSNQSLGLASNQNLGLSSNQNMGLANKQNLGLASNQNMGLASNQNMGLATNQNMGLATNQNMGLAPNQNMGLATNQNLMFPNTESSNKTMDRLEAALSDFGIKPNIISNITHMEKKPEMQQLSSSLELPMDLKPNPQLMLPPNMHFLTPPPKLPAHIENNKAKEFKAKNKNKAKAEKIPDNYELKAKNDDMLDDKFDDTPWLKVKKDERKKKEIVIDYDHKDWVLPKQTRKPAPGSKESKRLAEELKLQQEYEYKRKEDEMQHMLLIDDFQIKKDLSRQLIDPTKRVPWSSRPNTTIAARNEDVNLVEIQRLERERKVEQLKEQRLVMQHIAQQQAQAIQREQQMQSAEMVWSGKKNIFMGPVGGTNYDEYHAMSHRNQPMQIPVPMPPNPLDAIDDNIWRPINPAGFWETESKKAAEKLVEVGEKAMPEPAKPIKKPTVIPQPMNKRSSPIEEFEAWCASFLTPWNGQVDIPTFIGFLKDIESPFEVKDYVKVYLGDTKESNDFGRQFLERRSKILRAAMAAPVDDLGCPAAAINPRSMSGGDHDAKGKQKKKKNKMVKVDSSILGFSVTASNERFNVGDIDTA